MNTANIRIIKGLKDFIEHVFNDKELLSSFSMVDHAFTRKRKLSFDKLVLFIINLNKRSLSLELEDFFEQINLPCCSLSAYCQQRVKLNPLFFYYLNKALVRLHSLAADECMNKFKGYKLIAVDGSNISLINNKDLRETFEGQSNQHGAFVQAKTFYYYDILNGLVLDSTIENYKVGELKIAYSKVEVLEEDMIGIYDRNFFNYKMVAAHQWQEKERKFIMRMKTNLKLIRSFLQEEKEEVTETIYPTQYIIKEMRKAGYIVTETTGLTIRLIKVHLNTGVIEVLATNLWQSEGFEKEDFKELYAKRWDVETNIDLQKNIMKLECFSGLSAIAVAQDFFATVLVSNLHSIIVRGLRDDVEQQYRHRKYPMKINNNKAYARIKKAIIGLLLGNEPEVILMKIQKMMIKDVLPIRKGRSYERVTLNKQSKSKHKTYTNYKSAF